MTLASRRSAPPSPLPLANSSVSRLLIDSEPPSVSAAETIEAGAITSTVWVSVANGRSIDRAVVVSDMTTAATFATAKPSSAAVSVYFPSCSAVKRKWPSPSDNTDETS